MLVLTNLIMYIFAYHLPFFGDSTQQKKPCFLRITADYFYTGVFAVNPYVVGSSPTARAKI